MGIAVDSNNLDMVKTLIDKKADVNLMDKKGSPLWHATEQRNYEIMELLLNKDAIPNIASNDQLSPLRLAVKANDLKAIELLLKKGADPSYQKAVAR